MPSHEKVIRLAFVRMSEDTATLLLYFLQSKCNRSAGPSRLMGCGEYPVASWLSNAALSCVCSVELTMISCKRRLFRRGAQSSQSQPDQRGRHRQSITYTNTTTKLCSNGPQVHVALDCRPCLLTGYFARRCPSRSRLGRRRRRLLRWILPQGLRVQV